MMGRPVPEVADVVIAQEYIPRYRVPFFRDLRRLAAAEGVSVVIAAGCPSGGQASRGDAAELEGVVDLAQREVSVAGRRLTVRNLGRVTGGARLVVLEQARRNLDVYRLFVPRHRPIALWGHGWDQTQEVNALDRHLLDAMTRRADWFFGYTRAGVNHAVAAGLDPRRTTVVRNSTDTRALRVELGAVSEVRASQWRTHNDLRGRTALFLGALDSSKRIDFLLEAALHARELEPDFRLVVAGEGVLREKVRAFAAVHPWCRVVGALDGAARATALRCADLLAVPGRVGLVAVDSLVAEVPVVTVAASLHAPEFAYLEPGRTCVTTTDDPSAYASALVTLLDDKGRMGLMRKACAEEAEQYSIEGMAQRFLGGLLAALAQQSTRAVAG